MPCRNHLYPVPDVETFDITSLLVPGSNSLNVTLDAGFDDAISAIVAAVDLPAGGRTAAYYTGAGHVPIGRCRPFSRLPRPSIPQLAEQVFRVSCLKGSCTEQYRLPLSSNRGSLPAMYRSNRCGFSLPAPRHAASA